MLALARESRGYTQSELAKEAGIVPSLISKYEHDVSLPSDPIIDRLAGLLNYPNAFFFERPELAGLGPSALYHRKLRSMRITAQRRIQAQVNVLRLQIERLLRGVEMQPEYRFSKMDIDEYGNPEGIAQLLRAAWHLPLGSIRHLVGAIESNGGVVVLHPLGDRKMDGLSVWHSSLPPMFFLNDNVPGDRARFTLAHELGHVIMHSMPSEQMEDEANRFAAEFLMPRKEISSSLDNMTLAKAAALKVQWKVSMQAIIRRAKDLGKIPDSRYRRLCTEINVAGYRMREPLPIPLEAPTLMREVIDLHMRAHGLTLSDLSAMALMVPAEFRECYLKGDGPSLRVAR